MPKQNEIFDLPTQVHQGDFVLRLTEGPEDPAQTGLATMWSPRS